MTVLQLDTRFPRVAGDVACPATYVDEIEVIRIDGATVGQIVSNRPDLIDIAPFEDALARAKGDVIVTSCGFLSYWQPHLAGLTHKPFISSALTALGWLSKSYQPDEVLTLTFDADCLTVPHFGIYGDYAAGILGLRRDMHLRRVISENLTELDMDRASLEIAQHVAAFQRPQHKHLLLECTNLPPYKSAIRRNTGLPVTDILTCIETIRAGSIHPQFIT